MKSRIQGPQHAVERNLSPEPESMRSIQVR